MDPSARARAIAFLSAIDDRCAERRPACPGGHAILDGRHPALWSANHLRVERATAPDPAALVASRVATQLELGRDGEVGRQLASRDALIGTVVAVRRFAIVAAGEIAARCEVRADGAVAQVENLYVAPEHRGRGLARVVGEHALRAAWAGGARLVIGIADAEDWPQSFYRRLGFADAGLLSRFLRA